MNEWSVSFPILRQCNKKIVDGTIIFGDNAWSFSSKAESFTIETDVESIKFRAFEVSVRRVLFNKEYTQLSIFCNSREYIFIGSNYAVSDIIKSVKYRQSQLRQQEAMRKERNHMAKDLKDAATAQYKSGNKSEAFPIMLKAANYGNADAQQMVGYMYEMGEGTVKNEIESMRWYLAAAMQGHAQAQYCVAVNYDLGVGTPVNYGAALSWYTRAAEQNFFEAIIRAAIFNEFGLAGAVDMEEAVKWYIKAIQVGGPDAYAHILITRMQLLDKLQAMGKTIHVDHAHLPISANSVTSDMYYVDTDEQEHVMPF